MDDKRFWQATIEELQQGFVYDPIHEAYNCLICNQSYIKGVIYPSGDMLYDAEKAVRHHIEHEHDSMLDYFLGMNKQYTSLTEHQQALIAYFREGLSDRDIAAKLGASPSTIRNHRFKLKEKEKQSRVFLAMMGLLKDEAQDKETLIDIHRGATMVDERFAITEQEKQKVLKTYIDDKTGELIQFPSKEKRKIIVLQYIFKKFDASKTYTEKEINEVIRNFYSDFATIRRYLIEYGFIDRSQDCTQYWVKH
ncbi:DUF2087 domain-containing protein [Tuberibacillus sp. Marseille-P3662]|uniref:DUF2087 domain-containing protein n=1 Tax=Tuberibacillus sp. Marseille-P3662 TaxID=1965358 RepID=UPI000A1CF010|nr:DUF2087 domain-containing protein [Tuberibacillus sp. Marseille-P3662]